MTNYLENTSLGCCRHSHVTIIVGVGVVVIVGRIENDECRVDRPTRLCLWYRWLTGTNEGSRISIRQSDNMGVTWRVLIAKDGCIRVIPECCMVAAIQDLLSGHIHQELFHIRKEHGSQGCNLNGIGKVQDRLLDILLRMTRIVCMHAVIGTRTDVGWKGWSSGWFW